VARFRFGDRVRLGAMRGLVVLPIDGRLRAVAPDGRLFWLDHFVPDEGPDGPIRPNEWHRCAECGNATTDDILCCNCDGDLANARQCGPTAVFWELPQWARYFLQVRQARQAECDRHAAPVVPPELEPARRG
jgi:hypothetical protein